MSTSHTHQGTESSAKRQVAVEALHSQCRFHLPRSTYYRLSIARVSKKCMTSQFLVSSLMLTKFPAKFGIHIQAHSTNGVGKLACGIRQSQGFRQKAANLALPSLNRGHKVRELQRRHILLEAATVTCCLPVGASRSGVAYEYGLVFAFAC